MLAAVASWYTSGISADSHRPSTAYVTTQTHASVAMSAAITTARGFSRTRAIQLATQPAVGLLEQIIHALDAGVAQLRGGRGAGAGDVGIVPPGQFLRAVTDG